MPRVQQNEVVEVSLGAAFESERSMLDVKFVDPSGVPRAVPAFISHGEWRVRYASPTVGTHAFSVSAGPVTDAQAGEVFIVPREEKDSLEGHGPLRVAAKGRHLEHVDGTPFLWLADTWWDGFTDRLTNDQFAHLAQQRAEQGFSVVQIVAGLYPEMTPFAQEGKSMSGWAWQAWASPRIVGEDQTLI